MDTFPLDCFRLLLCAELGPHDRSQYLGLLSG
jgi:hypothetical protein